MGSSSFSFGQYRPGDSFLHKLDPRNKISCSFLLVIVTMLLRDLDLLFIFGVSLLFLVVVSRISISLFLNSIKMVFVLIVFTMIANLFFTPGEIVFQWGILKISREGFSQGVITALKFLYIVTITSLVTITTSPMSFTDGLIDLLKPLKRVGFPAEEMALMMSIAIRFIPTLWEETDRIRKAQISRGANFEKGGILKRIKHITALMVPILVSAFRRADELALAMESRAFQVGQPRSRMRVLSFRGQDYMVSLIVVVLFIITVIYRFNLAGGVG